MSEFAGRTAVVTGAGSGIGRALALGLARRGSVVAVSDVDAVGLAETTVQLAALGVRHRVDELDVTDRKAVLAYAEAITWHLNPGRRVLGPPLSILHRSRAG